MPILAPQNEPLALTVGMDDTMLRVYIVDGREIAVPLEWFPRLRDATVEQRANWRLIGGGEGIHWPDIDEDVSVFRLFGLPD